MGKGEAVFTERAVVAPVAAVVVVVVNVVVVAVAVVVAFGRVPFHVWWPCSFSPGEGT